MNFFSDFGKGVYSHVKAFQFIARHGLWGYFLYPVVIMILLFVFGFWSTFSLGGKLADHVISLIGFSDPGEGWMHWLDLLLGFLIGFILKILLLYIFSSFLKYIVLIVCSPIMAALSTRTEEILTGIKTPFNFNQYISDLIRGLIVVIRAMFFQGIITLACLFIAWIPVIGYISLPLMWIVGWYFLGFFMMDYTYERRRLKISEGAAFTRKHKGIAIGNGMVFSFLLWIPFLGIVIAPIVSSVAGTLATLDALDKTPRNQ